MFADRSSSPSFLSSHYILNKENHLRTERKKNKSKEISKSDSWIASLIRCKFPWGFKKTKKAKESNNPLFFPFEKKVKENVLIRLHKNEDPQLVRISSLCERLDLTPQETKEFAKRGVSIEELSKRYPKVSKQKLSHNSNKQTEKITNSAAKNIFVSGKLYFSKKDENSPLKFKGRIGRKFAEGSLGELYDLESKITKAIKIAKDEKVYKQEGEDDANVLAKRAKSELLNEKTSIKRILDYCKVKGLSTQGLPKCPKLVMEMRTGEPARSIIMPKADGTLADLVYGTIKYKGKNYRLTMVERLEMAKGLLIGLSRMQSAQMHHGDIKALNILYKIVGEKDKRPLFEVYHSDFGTMKNAFEAARSPDSSHYYLGTAIYQMYSDNKLMGDLHEKINHARQDWLAEGSLPNGSKLNQLHALQKNYAINLMKRDTSALGLTLLQLLLGDDPDQFTSANTHSPEFQAIEVTKIMLQAGIDDEQITNLIYGLVNPEISKRLFLGEESKLHQALEIIDRTINLFKENKLGKTCNGKLNEFKILEKFDRELQCLQMKMNENIAFIKLYNEGIEKIPEQKEFFEMEIKGHEAEILKLSEEIRQVKKAKTEAYWNRSELEVAETEVHVGKKDEMQKSDKLRAKQDDVSDLEGLIDWKLNCLCELVSDRCNLEKFLEIQRIYSPNANVSSQLEDLKMLEAKISKLQAEIEALQNK